MNKTIGKEIELIGNNDSFRIVKLTDISVNELRELQNKGFIITRSAHIGNQYPSNMILARAGISTFLVDKTDISKDMNYKPGEIVIGQQKYSLGAKGLTILSKVENTENLNPKMSFLSETPNSGSGIGYLHTASFKNIFPQADIFTATEFYCRNDQMINSIISGIIGYNAINKTENIDFTLLFDRYIFNGRLERIKKFGNKYMIGENIKFLTQEQLFEEFITLNNNLQHLLTKPLGKAEFGEIAQKANGPICSNNFNIVLVEVINCILSGKDTVYHCSGPDYINYCETVKEDCKFIYDLIKSTSGLSLPSQITYYLIPTALLKLLTLDNQISDQISSLISGRRKLAEIEQQKRLQIGKAKLEGENINEVIGRFKGVVDSTSLEISRLIELIGKGLPDEYLFGHIKNTSRYFTQYDLGKLLPSDINKIFESVADVKITEIGAILDRLKKSIK